MALLGHRRSNGHSQGRLTRTRLTGEQGHHRGRQPLTTEGLVNPLNTRAHSLVQVGRHLDGGDVGAESGGVLELDAHSLLHSLGGIALLT